MAKDHSVNSDYIGVIFAICGACVWTESKITQIKDKEMGTSTKEIRELYE